MSSDEKGDEKGDEKNMDIFDTEIFAELKETYCREGLTDEDYYILFQRFSNMSHLNEVKPFLYAMRYFGMGTEANPEGVLKELKSMSLKDDIQMKGLACDLLLFQKRDDRILSELKKMKDQGYSDIYLREKSHLHQLVSLNMPRCGEMLYYDRIACGVRHICAIKADGHLVSYGWNKFGQCDVEAWEMPTKICCDGISTFGIFANGSIKVVGALNTPENKIINEWKNIIDCKGTLTHIFGLNDGGKLKISRDGLYEDALEWNNIVQIVSSASGNLIGLKNDGKLVAIKVRDPQGMTEIHEWDDIVQISGCTVGLRGDGTVLYAGNGLAGADEVTSWKGIVQVAATSDVTYGLLGNGDVVCTPYNVNKDKKNVVSDKGQRMIEDWHNIVSIWAGKDFVIGLTKSGHVMFAGDGSDGLGDIQNLKLF